MVVLQVCNFISRCPGNFIFLLKGLEKKIVEEGGEMIYIFPEPAKDREWCKEIQKRAKVYFVPYEDALKKVNTYKIIRKVCSKHKVNIVHSHHDAYDFPVTLMAPLKTKVFIHLHNAIGENYWNHKGIIRGLKYVVGRQIYKRANLISVSEHHRKIACKKRFNINKSRVLLNGISLDRIPKTEQLEKQFNFLTFASDFYGKGGDLVIEACKRLANEGYRFKLLFCSGGRKEGWKEFEKYFPNEMPEWIETCNVVDDIGELYSKCNVFISASRKETFSFSVCEAIYSGMKVISTDIPGLEWAKNIPSVEFCQNEDPNDLLRVMKNCIANNYTVNISRIEKSRNIIEEKYSQDTWVKNLLNIYKGK